jgi:hypothetical protein
VGKEDITINISEIKMIFGEYFEILYFSKLESLEGIDKFLDT